MCICWTTLENYYQLLFKMVKCKYQITKVYHFVNINKVGGSILYYYKEFINCSIILYKYLRFYTF